MRTRIIRVKGYVRYLKEVCFVPTIEKIHLDADVLRSLVHFSNLSKRTIETAEAGSLECGYYQAPTRACGPFWSGHYYTLRTPSSSTTAYLFFGIVFEAEPKICVVLEQDWNKPIYDRSSALDGTAGEYFEAQKAEEMVNFNLRPAHYQTFNASSKDEQEALLRAFFNEVAGTIGRCPG